MTRKLSLLIVVLAVGLFASAQSKTAQTQLLSFGDYLFSAGHNQGALGQPAQTIPGIVEQFNKYPGESYDGQAQYANAQITIQRSDWIKTQQSLPSPFSDRSFPANVNSLRGKGLVKAGEDSSSLQKMNSYSFKRASQIAPNLVVIKGANVNFGDVKQGGLGDCYFLASLSAIARNPQRLERNLLQRVKSNKGAYAVNYCLAGQWTTVFFDDQLAVNSNGQPAFSLIKDQTAWPVLFEKAYAKLYGGYWHIGNGGAPADAMRDILGVPTMQYSFKDSKVASTGQQTIIDAERNKWPVVFGTKGDSEAPQSNGIVSMHAYSLMGVVKLSNGLTLFRLRNPWSQGEWNGAWSDKSPLWTPQFKKEAGWVDADDGLFFMNYNDFVENFDSFDIAYYQDNFIYSALQTTSAKGSDEKFQISVSQAGEYYIGLIQQSRFEFGNDPNYKYGFLSGLVLQRLANNNFKVIDGFHGSQRDNWTKMKLDKGDYLVIVFSNLPSASTKYSLWTYGVKNTVIKKVRGGASVQDVISKAFIAQAVSTQADWKTIFPENGKAAVRSKTLKVGSYNANVYQNLSNSGRKFTAKGRLTGNGARVIVPPNNNNPELVVAKGETKIVVYRMESIPSSYGFSSSFSF